MNWRDHLTLKGDETVLWEGRPVVWRSVASYLVLAALGLAFGGGAYLLWTQPDGPRDAGYWVTFSMLCFVNVAALTAPLQAWFQANRTTYVLTNQRAVVLVPGLFRRCKVEAFSVREWKLEVWPGRKGAGSILFGAFGLGGRLGFKNLADISVVEPLVRRLAAECAVKRPVPTRAASLV